MKKEILFIGLIALLLFSGCIEPPQPVPNKKYCETDSDCACGTYLETGDCFYGNKEFVNTEKTCADFCTGYMGDLKIKCVQNTCKQVQKQETADYEVHEWGVLAGCTSSDDYFLTSRPEEVKMVVKEPVIYIHSNDVKEFDLRVEFKEGKHLLNYPETEIKGEKIEWNNVKVSDDCQTETIGATKRFNPVPLEEIIPILNNVDADCLEVFNGEQARFLFYEGEMQFENKITVDYVAQSMKAKIKNNGFYVVYDLALSVEELMSVPQEGFYDNPNLGLGFIEELKPGEEKSIELKDIRIDLKEKMTGIGFTEKEAGSFASLWQDNFYHSQYNTKGYSKTLSYRLPQSETEKMISLNFDPEPKKVLRSLWVMVNIEN